MAAYGDDAGFAAWLADNGFVLPIDAPTAAVLRQRGSSYLDATYAPKLWCSAKTGGFDQEREWPRTRALTAGGTEIDPNTVPSAWVRASYRAAWLEASSPGSLSASINTSERVKRQKADVIEREFFDGGAVVAGAGGLAMIDAEIDGMVAPYLCSAYAGRFAALVV